MRGSMLLNKLIFFISLPCIVLGIGATMEDARRLQQYLLDHNERWLRPKINQSETIEVSFKAYLVGIQHFDEIKQIIVQDIALHFMWIHETIGWSTSDYGGIDIAFLPPSKVWLPDVGIFNVVDDWNERLVKESMNVLIHPNGTIHWAIHFTALSTVCPVDITRYPFDEQECEVDMGPFYLPLARQVMSSDMYDEQISTSMYTENNEWDLVSYYLHEKKVPGFDVKHHIITIKLQRRSLFYVLTIITPVLTLTIMNLISFKLPASSGEKAGYCMAMFLTFVVLLNTISDSMPRISKTTSYLQIYIIIQLITSMIITTLSIGMVNIINTHDQNNVHKILTSMMKWCRKKKDKQQEVYKDIRKASVDMIMTNFGIDTKFQEAYGYTKEIEEPKEEITISKQEVTDFVDDGLFLIFLFMFLVSTFTCCYKLFY